MERRVKVLIADDRETTRRGLRALLSLSSRMEVVGEAMDGRAAVHMVAVRHPDVVLMDMKMPVMDGVEAARRIKEQWPEVKVIALSMYPRYRVMAISAGVDAFLLKGSPSEVLQDAVLAQRPELFGGENGS